MRFLQSLPWCALLVFPLMARQPVRTRNAMVAAQEPYATDVGVAVLKSGGNAVDAAVAVAFALAVTHPAAGNLGGGGFLLIRDANGATNFIDFRERAPQAASRDMYLDSKGELRKSFVDANGNTAPDSIAGYRAAGVPGTVRGLELAHKKYGRMRWADLVAPALRLAREGFEVSYRLSESLKNSAKLLEQFDESKRIFLKGGALYEPGDRLIQSDLARTLERIAHNGAAGFYGGESARKLAEFLHANGGLITEKDLASYRAVERRPLEGDYRGLKIITAPPPSSGGVGLLQMLGVLERSGYEKHGAGSAASIHFVAETMRRFYADRSEFLGDPDFVKIPVSRLLDRDYIQKLRGSIDLQKATPSARVKPGGLMTPVESEETTHFSIVDQDGKAIALTYTINGSFGSGVTVPGLGFLLNNEMDDFAAKPGTPNLFGLIQGERNVVAPGKRPLSSMTPTIVLRKGKPYLVIGAPGGSRIINGVLQVILNVVDFGMNVQDAVDAPRFHHQWEPDRLGLERGFSPDTIALLSARGHAIERTAGVAVVEAVLIDHGWLQGGSDGRGGGKAAGY
jgi:gamma-glutamyltranspeptidase/glutathione hydrolase